MCQTPMPRTLPGPSPLRWMQTSASARGLRTLAVADAPSQVSTPHQRGCAYLGISICSRPTTIKPVSLHSSGCGTGVVVLQCSCESIWSFDGETCVCRCGRLCDRRSSRGGCGNAWSFGTRIQEGGHAGLQGRAKAATQGSWRSQRSSCRCLKFVLPQI